MKQFLTSIILATTVVAVVPLLPAAPVKISLPPETAKLKPGPGAELVTGQCLICHSAEYISTQPRLTRPAWKASVQKMKDKYGAPVAAGQMDALVDYLVKNYGTEPAPVVGK